MLTLVRFFALKKLHGIWKIDFCRRRISVKLHITPILRSSMQCTIGSWKLKGGAMEWQFHLILRVLHRILTFYHRNIFSPIEQPHLILSYVYVNVHIIIYLAIVGIYWLVALMLSVTWVDYSDHWITSGKFHFTVK